MPEITVNLGAGRTAETKEKLMTAITNAVVSTLGAPIDAVVVTILETPLTDKMKGGILFTERAKKRVGK
jgi:4-oxalocrotonate tautomerase